jgi:hypothetical protein
MNVEFESGTITIQADASDWGPFTFDLESAVSPLGRTIASAVVKTYLGRVKPTDSDVLSSKTETTSELINTNSMSSNYVVAVYFNRPTTAAYINQKHSLVITFTLDAAGGGGTHTAFFYNVNVI